MDVSFNAAYHNAVQLAFHKAFTPKDYENGYERVVENFGIRAKTGEKRFSLPLYILREIIFRKRRAFDCIFRGNSL